MKTCPSTVSLAKTRLLFFCVVLFVAIFSVPGQCPTNNKLPICTNVLMNKGLAQMNVMKFSCVASWARLHLRQSNYFSCLHNLHQSLIPYVNCNCPANAFVFYKSYLKKKNFRKKNGDPFPPFLSPLCTSDSPQILFTDKIILDGFSHCLYLISVVAPEDFFSFLMPFFLPRD